MPFRYSGKDEIINMTKVINYCMLNCKLLYFTYNNWFIKESRTLACWSY